MYTADADPGAVQAAYDAYYATHPFVKNTHTQFFKRWKRELGHAIVPRDPAQRAAYEEGLGAYLDASAHSDDIGIFVHYHHAARACHRAQWLAWRQLKQVAGLVLDRFDPRIVHQRVKLHRNI